MDKKEKKAVELVNKFVKDEKKSTELVKKYFEQGNDFKLSYDYEELIEELEEEIFDGVLDLNDKIQILKGEAVDGGYEPIIDWYYDKVKMENLLTALINVSTEDILLNEEEEIEELIEIKKQYLKNKSNLITMRLEDVLDHMKEMNRIL